MAEDDRVEEGSEESQPLPSWEQLWPPISYWSRAATAVVVVVMAVLALAALRNVLLVVVAAFVIALGLQPALTDLERRGLRRGSAMAVIVLGGLILAAGAAAAIVPTVVGQAATAIERLPELISDLESRSPLMANILDQVDLGGAEGEPGAIGVVGSVAQGLFFTVTLLLLTPYFAVAFPAMKSGMFRLLRADHRADYVYVINQATELTSNYIVGNLTISLVAGVVTFIGLTIIGVPYALALAVWVAVADLIPAVGALVGAIPVLVVAAMTGSQQLIWALILILVYQQFENYVLAPRVMKRAVDLSPLLVIIALMIGGTLAGIVGALLALPIAALVKILVMEFLIRRRIEKVRTERAAARPGQSRPRRLLGKVGSRPLP